MLVGLSVRVSVLNDVASRQQQSGGADEVAVGAAHNRILQRLKLNERVALVTGGLSCPSTS